MRLGRIVSALPFLAVGLALWKHARWVASPENSAQDGTCAGIEEIISDLFSWVSFLLSLLVLLKGIPLRRLVRLVEGEGDGPCDRHLIMEADAGVGRRPRPLNPSEDTTDFFD
jgi:hypothetical protein